MIKDYPCILSQLLFLLEKPVKQPGVLSLPFSLERLGMLPWSVLLLPAPASGAAFPNGFPGFKLGLDTEMAPH